jgi:hypothetical protein
LCFPVTIYGGGGANKTNKEIQEEALCLMEHILKERKTQPKWFKIKKEYIKNGRSK